MINLDINSSSLNKWELAMIMKDVKYTKTRPFLGVDHNIFVEELNKTANEKSIKLCNERIITWECDVDLILGYELKFHGSESTIPKNYKLELGIHSKNFVHRELIFYIGVSRIDTLHGMIPFKILIDKYKTKNIENIFLSTFAEIKYIIKNHMKNLIHKLQNTFPNENQINFLLLESGKKTLTPWISVGNIYKKMNLKTNPNQFDFLMLQGKEVRENKKINLQMNCMYEFFNLCHYNQF